VQPPPPQPKPEPIQEKPKVVEPPKVAPVEEKKSLIKDEGPKKLAVPSVFMS